MNDSNLPDEIWPDRDRQIDLLNEVSNLLLDGIDRIQRGPVAPEMSPRQIRQSLADIDFKASLTPAAAANMVIKFLTDGSVQVMHPGYFGLFNSSVFFPAILADLITATINPQLAVWSHAPAANEIERYIINSVAGLFGWKNGAAAGHFTSGGTEANATSIQLALTRAFPEFGETGARALPGEPRAYVSAESHGAWRKIAHHAGLGRNSIVLVPTDGTGRMDPNLLAKAIEQDRNCGKQPYFIGATAGTTNAGMIDPLAICAKIAEREDLWFHVDGAWGGAGILNGRIAPCLDGIAAADSITIDAHKWLAVPMGAGMLICRDSDLLGRTFRISATYMPEQTDFAVGPYSHSLQWSRRFIGLKLFMTLATLGWDGYRAHIENAVSLADELAQLLEADGWRIVNDSPLAVLCFKDSRDNTDPDRLAQFVVADGNAWISTTRFEGQPVLRACITSHFTRRRHLESLVDALNRARAAKNVGA